MSTPPPRLLSFAGAIGAKVADTPAGWTAALDLVGCWPIPAGDLSFGKRSSCVVGASIPISCAEVELTLRARQAGWTGGWMSAYNPNDRRFPGAWRQALITQREARDVVGCEFPGATVAISGIPDLVFVRDGRVVVAECKRLRGRYRTTECELRTGGDAFKGNQDKWATDALAAGIPREAILAIWWNRIDVAECG